MAEKKPYSEAVNTGQYTRQTGLTGKYDNVRRFWEDEVTRLFVRSLLKEIVDKKARKLERLKVLDLGCGSGDGYDLLMNVTAKDVGIYEYSVDLISETVLGKYLGVDLNEDLLNQAREHYGSNEKIIFRQGDFSGGLPVKDESFDIYFTSYGTFSHNHDEQTVKLLSDIALSCETEAIVVCDWLGKFSYEWQDLWTLDTDQETFMDYRISYIYSPEERQTAEIQSFPLRLLSRNEAMKIIREASEQSGVEIKLKRCFDRSIFVGRHIDTAEYNSYCPPIRQSVNSLLEPNVRTNLGTLIIDYMPRTGFDQQNKFLEGFAMCWNTLIKHTMGFLSEYQEELTGENDLAEFVHFYPEPLKNVVKTMKKVIDATGELPGDARANIIEPQLAYALRKLEMEMQQGLAMGHGLVCILEIKK
jgi:SAM-dependent methyltransferase